jgi:hypothetical protein
LDLHAVLSSCTSERIRPTASVSTCRPEAEEEAREGYVLLTIIENAFGSQPVSSSSTGLLVVALEGLWDVVVDDIADVWLVDPHTESDCEGDAVDRKANQLICSLQHPSIQKKKKRMRISWAYS